MKRILFVCVENSNRSQMAEAFAHIHGGEKVEAYSAGSRPSGIVNPKAIEAMRELGSDLSGQRSKSVVDLPDIEFDFVATMGCGDASRLFARNAAKIGTSRTRKRCRRKNFAPFAIILGAKSKLCSRRWTDAR